MHQHCLRLSNDQWHLNKCVIFRYSILELTIKKQTKCRFLYFLLNGLSSISQEIVATLQQHILYLLIVIPRYNREWERLVTDLKNMKLGAIWSNIYEAWVRHLITALPLTGLQYIHRNKAPFLVTCYTLLPRN